jgi:hypothetical protein
VTPGEPDESHTSAIAKLMMALVDGAEPFVVRR